MQFTCTGYKSITGVIRSVCCDAPLIMLDAWSEDAAHVFCCLCGEHVGSPTGQDFADLYRDRFPRWVKGEQIRQVLLSLTDNMKQARIALESLGQRTYEAFGAFAALTNREALSNDSGKRVAGINSEHLREQARYFQRAPFLSYEDNDDH